MTVFFATPVILTVERIEHPSIKHEITRERCVDVSRFMIFVMHDPVTHCQERSKEECNGRWW